MMKKNFFRFSLFFAAIVILLMILFFPILNKTAIKPSIRTKAQTKPAPPAILLLPTIPPIKSSGWTAYTSKQYSFTLIYPQDWQLQEQSNVNGIEIQKVDKQGIGFSISIRLLDNPNKLSIKDFAVAQAYPRENGIYDDPQMVSVDAVTGYKLAYLPKSLLLDVFLPYKDGVINIFAGGDINLTIQKNRDYYNEIISQILHSFKFSP